MKLISLNTWGGRVHKELITFLEKNKEVEIFCFQEIYSKVDSTHVEQGGLHPSLTLFEDIQKVLPDHEGFFRPQYLENYGLAAFIRKDIQVTSEKDVFVYHHKGFIPEGEVGNHARNIQIIQLLTTAGPRTIINFHGLWKGGADKLDIPERILQSENILQSLRTIQTPFVLCGDFNLLPTTQSLKMLEDFGLRNLIKEYGIPSTRTSYYPKPDKFADYALVSKEITIKDFKVLPDEVSDHSALYVEFE